MTSFKSTIFVLFFFCTTLIYSQENPAEIFVKDHIGGSIELSSMHLWRGQEVSDEVNLVTDVYFKTKGDAFRAGLWGGAGVNGNYKEFDYYASYTVKGLTFAVWDIYNFSPDATYNNRQAFNYKARETGHFIDVSVAYQMPKSFPLKIYYSTIVFGRDRGPLNDNNKYSTFIQLDYPLLSYEGFSLNTSVAGAFSYKTKANFYGDTGGIVDIRLRLAKDITIAGYKLPIYVMPMWNPQASKMNMQFGVTLFSL